MRLRALPLLAAFALLSSGCGIYVHRGGGAYTYIGDGAGAAARRCHMGYALGKAEGRLDCHLERMQDALKALDEKPAEPCAAMDLKTRKCLTAEEVKAREAQ